VYVYFLILEKNAKIIHVLINVQDTGNVRLMDVSAKLDGLGKTAANQLVLNHVMKDQDVLMVDAYVKLALLVYTARNM